MRRNVNNDCHESAPTFSVASLSVLVLVLAMLLLPQKSLGQSGAATTPPDAAQGYKLVFDEDFHNFDISPDGLGDHNWYNGLWYQSVVAQPRNIYASDSVLTLKWTKDQQSGTTCITTMSKDGRYSRAWRYGYFEARLRFDTVAGSWPAFWMIPVEAANSRDSKLETGELDIFESQSTSPNIFYGTIHRWMGSHDVENNASTNSFHLPPGVNLSQYHTYGALWVPGRVTWYFDGLKILSAPTYAVFDSQHYALVICSQVGTNWVTNDRNAVSASSISVQATRVRVWQR